jgi:hypothetical protein
MTHKYIGLLFALTLVSCSTSQAPLPPKKPVIRVVATLPNNMPKGSCNSVYTLKTGESTTDRDNRLWSVNSMANTEADLIASNLSPQITATGTQPALPISSIQKDIETQCRQFASEVVEYQPWLGVTAACLYPKCTKATVAKLNSKLKSH